MANDRLSRTTVAEAVLPLIEYVDPPHCALEKLLTPDRRDHAAPAALVALLGPEGQPARHRAPAFTDRPGMKVAVYLVGHCL